MGHSVHNLLTPSVHNLMTLNVHEVLTLYTGYSLRRYQILTTPLLFQSSEKGTVTYMRRRKASCMPGLSLLFTLDGSLDVKCQLCLQENFKYRGVILQYGSVGTCIISVHFNPFGPL